MLWGGAQMKVCCDFLAGGLLVIGLIELAQGNYWDCAVSLAFALGNGACLK